MIYNRRIWLNRKMSRSTGSVCAYFGPYKCSTGEVVEEAFLEIADCHGKARLHMSSTDTKIDFINKLDLLAATIEKFSNFLKRREIMSYSLERKCECCEKKDQCSDRHFIEGAISGIHSVYPQEKGHLGAGTIILDCQNFVEKIS